MFLLVPAYPGCPGQAAVKWLLLLFLVLAHLGSLGKGPLNGCVCNVMSVWGLRVGCHSSCQSACVGCPCAGLRVSDSAVYTCRAVSETGESAWSAVLTVRAPSNPSIVFHRTPEPSTFPGAPSKPTVADVTPTGVRLAWRPSANTGASRTHAYSVEYFSHDTGDVSAHRRYRRRSLRQAAAYRNNTISTHTHTHTHTRLTALFTGLPG